MANNFGISYCGVGNSGINLIKYSKPYILNFIRIRNIRLSHYRNRKLISSSNESLGTSNLTNFKIGRHSYWTNSDSDFNLSEFIFINEKISDSRRKQIEEYLAKKYNIQLEE